MIYDLVLLLVCSASMASHRVIVFPPIFLIQCSRFIEQVAQDYNNEQIVKLFGKQMEKLGERKAALMQAKVEERAQRELHMKQFREQNEKVQQQLDQSIEAFEDKFTDTMNAVEYDAARLEKKYLRGKYLSASKLPCLSERAEIASCYQQNSTNTGSCDVFLEALTACTNKTITSASQ